MATELGTQGTGSARALPPFWGHPGARCELPELMLLLEQGEAAAGVGGKKAQQTLPRNGAVISGLCRCPLGRKHTQPGFLSTGRCVPGSADSLPGSRGFAWTWGLLGSPSRGVDVHHGGSQPPFQAEA